jgi:2-polyprenyl-3-methyl-5-hydroxy-6-metoxy-1,4-benzoquinol methylase
MVQIVAQVVQGVRQRLRDLVQEPKEKGLADKRLAEQLHQERERRQRAESELRRLQQNGAAATTKQTHALPEPDDSINKHKIFRTLIPSFMPGKMLDLGAGKGQFSLTAARLGWEVTAVDIRTVRWPDLEAAENPRRAELIRSVRWVQADVREFPVRSGEYDLICILGLLHRLEVDDQIELLRRCSGTLTLLDTRIAPEIVDAEGPYDGEYHHQGGETLEERNQNPVAAWGNEFGFWHTEESLLRLVRDCGYSKMMSMKPPHRQNYTFFLCLPPPP